MHNVPWNPSAAERRTLAALADAIFPIDAWMNQKAYKPDDPKVPWRQGYEVVDARSLASIDFIVDGLLGNGAEEQGDQALAARWAGLQASPPDAYKAMGVPEWRCERGLDAAPVFAPADSENFTVAQAAPIGECQPKRALSRRQLYAEFMPHLMASVAASKPANWARYAADASRGDAAHPPPLPAALKWPAGAPHPMEFLLQFGRDLSVAVLSLRNPAANATAVLAEAGEHRRPGNAYTAAQAEEATARFMGVLRRLVPKPAL
jgi:hypothetical protein